MSDNVWLPNDWQVHGAQRRVLLAFVSAPAGVMTFDQVIEAARSGARGDSVAPLARRHIRQLNTKLGHLGVTITSRWGEGYEMPAASREIIRNAIQQRLAA
ncbi:hypothetical protein RPMA_12350 [Tardiphaga alba]|uniref:Transcriptional regulator n=1 Tax=Tardiphaga alba TaxID=340268 RepID=A0ABX8A7B2_9BRAD|nr:hypothetical protein [Tardiphaga alba]QUS39538.1 hypothetical protein RPMA_12350 [Tardiphaga alba]